MEESEINNTKEESEEFEELLDVLWQVAPKCTNTPLHEKQTMNIATYRYFGYESIQYACDGCIDTIDSDRKDYERYSPGKRATELLDRYKGVNNG